MRRKIFLFSSILLIAAVVIAGGAAFLIVAPELTTAEFWSRELPAALWIFPALIILAVPTAYLFSRRITDPIRRIDLDSPEEDVPYEELVPLLAHIREQDREIRLQKESMGRTQRDFETITDNMTESILVLDRRLNVDYRNISAGYLLPPPGDGAPDNLMRGSCPEEIVLAAEKALVGNRTELVLRLHERFYQVIVTPIYSENQITGAVIIAMDITDREEREALRREFSANVSHELKTPLTSISGFAELLRDGAVPPERTGEFAGEILKQAQRMTALIEDIMELSRLEDDSVPVERETVDLYALAKECREELLPQAEKSGVTLTLKGGPTEIVGVRAALREMIHNLADNAIKYNHAGGAAEITVSRDADGAALIVEDTGIGIPFEHQNRVFERFYRVDKSHSREIGGTGLGLSIVKHAARLHKARLELRSTPGVGTVITIRFPREADPEKKEGYSTVPSDAGKL